MIEPSNAVVLTAEVVAVDKKDRNVSLRYPDGNVTVVEVGQDVRNFDRIAIGDQVKIEASNSVELYLNKPKQEQGGITVERETKGEKPRATAVERFDVTATVKAIDKENRAVTLELPDGENVITKAGPSDKAFEKLKVGDSFQARLTRSISISVGKE